MTAELSQERQSEPFLDRGVSSLPIGATVDGRYEVTSILGSGGMGEVYEVVHLGLGKPFALKCLKKTALEDQRAAARFVKEIRGLASVHSEFVVGICDCGELENGSPYFVMERLRGLDLRKVLMEEDGLTPLRAVKLTIDACLGLQAVHEAGLVHRDLKPENLFITHGSDGNERCKVLDFGIAKPVGSGSTKQHALLGTLKYMAPEQLADPRGVGPETDIYSLGAILFECLAGRPPHVAETEPELMFKILNSEPLPLSTLVPSLDPELCSVVARALHKDPDRRYGSAVALAGALASCLVAYSDDGQTEPSDHERLIPRQTKAAKSKRWLVVAVAAGFGLGWGGELLSSGQAVPAPSTVALRGVASPTQLEPAVHEERAIPEEPPPPQPELLSSTVEQPALVRKTTAQTGAAPRSAKPAAAAAPSASPKASDASAVLPAIDEGNPYE